ncbi:MAG: dolichyl-phosphate beta-glucosyltransferase [Patescibacteria group bacterium]
MELSIIIPVYNEEKRIGKTLSELQEYLSKCKLEYEVIVVDDGSTDQTSFMLYRYKSFIKILPVWPNRGKGHAIRLGMLMASGQKILFMDADLATPLYEVKKILQISGDYDLVIGSRSDQKIAKRERFRSLCAKIFNSVTKVIFPLQIKDTQCGFKLFTNAAAKEIFSRARINRWAFDIEVLFLAKKLGFSIGEQSVAWEEKAGSKVRMFRDASRMIVDLVRIRIYNLFDFYHLKAEERSEDDSFAISQKPQEIKEL